MAGVGRTCEGAFCPLGRTLPQRCSCPSSCCSAAPAASIHERRAAARRLLACATDFFELCQPRACLLQLCPTLQRKYHSSLGQAANTALSWPTHMACSSSRPARLGAASRSIGSSCRLQCMRLCLEKMHTGSWSGEPSAAAARPASAGAVSPRQRAAAEVAAAKMSSQGASHSGGPCCCCCCSCFTGLPLGRWPAPRAQKVQCDIAWGPAGFD